VGRRVLVGADLDRVRVWCDGGLVADHERVWARHQTISDPARVTAGQLLRQQRFTLIPPATETEVEQRLSSTTTPRWAWPNSTKRWRCDRHQTAARNLTGEIAYLTRALTAPTLRESAGRLAERARTESWTMRSIWWPT